MNFFSHDTSSHNSMTNATALTRQGKLTEATQLIQKALARSNPNSAPTPGEKRLSLPPPSTLSPPAEGGQTGRARPQTFVDRNWSGKVPSNAPRKQTTPVPPLQPVKFRREARDQQPDEQGVFLSAEFNHAGISVPYRLYIPSTTGFTKMPLLVLLHGCTQDATDFATGTAMNSVAQDNGIAVLYPTQTARGNANKCWNWFEPAHQVRGSGEPAALSALTKMVCIDNDFDMAKVFVAGMSAGGAMAVVLGEQYPEQFSAVGIHSGLPSGIATNMMQALSAMNGNRNGGLKNLDMGAFSNPDFMARQPSMPAANGEVTGHSAPPSKRESSRAQPYIVFHGGMDRTVDATNAQAIVTNCLHSATEVNGRISSQCTQPESERGSVTLTTYRDRDDRVICENWHLHAAGHRWSGGNPAGSHTDATGPDASAEMVRFFLSSV